MADPLALARGAKDAVPLRNVAEMVTGGLNSSVAGRTDHLPVSTPAGAYVIPADVVSYLGQGNTQAGIRHLDMLFGRGAQQAPGVPAAKVDVMVAGGEYIVPPQVVAALGGGDQEAGHELLDRFVKEMRKRNIAHLRSFPGPVTDGTR